MTIAEKSNEMGGRLLFETKLPGLNTWARVNEYRLYALKQMSNVELYLDSELDAEDILNLEHQRVAIATGSYWTKALYSSLEIPLGELNKPNVYTPDDLARGVVPESPVLVYDFDNYYLGGVIAESLAQQGIEVSYATPAGHASAWTIMTNEQPYVHQALDVCNVDVHTQKLLSAFDEGEATLSNIFTNKSQRVPAKSVVIVGLRMPNDGIYQSLMARSEDFAKAGIKSIHTIGDALAPGALVHAVHSGHSFSRELDRQSNDLYLRDIPVAEYPPGPVI